jgi:hypothetical protein
MHVGRRARIGLLVLTAMVVGLVAPCICGPSARAAQAAHACCEAEAGWKPAPMDCCSSCSPLLPQDPWFLRDSPQPSLLVLIPWLGEPAFERTAVSLAPRSALLFALPPLPTLRV